ncbi:MAG: hypothetical protein ACK4E5_07010 [Erythrobacter cryptus]
MARPGRAARRTRKAKAQTQVEPQGDQPPLAAEPPPRAGAGLLLPSPRASTNVMIADIVLRAAGSLLRDRLEKGLLVQSYGLDEKGRAKATRLIEGRSLGASLALWGASHLARRSPLGLALVAGSLALKVLYDRGKRLETKRRPSRRQPAAPPAPDDKA